MACLIVLDEGLEVGFEIAGQIIVFEQDLIFERLVPALDFAVGLRMTGGAADVIDISLVEPFSQIGCDEAGAVVRQQSSPHPQAEVAAA